MITQVLSLTAKRLVWEIGCTKPHRHASMGSGLLGSVPSASSTRTRSPQRVSYSQQTPHFHSTRLAEVLVSQKKHSNPLKRKSHNTSSKIQPTQAEPSGEGISI